MKRTIRTLSLLLICLAAILVGGACDPMAALGPQAQVTVTPPPTRTRPPTITPTLPGTPTTTPTDAPTATPPDCTESTGQTVDDSFASKVTHTTVPYRVYLPPCYQQSNRRYPYVILLHGSDQDEKQWTDHLKANLVIDDGLSKQTLPPMILVMPQGGDLANTNIFKAGASYESLILDELIPLIDSSLCTWNTREGRAIGGISRGGFWAFEIAFRHPALFGAVGGHSPFFDPKNAPPDYNPLELAKTVRFPEGQQPRIWTDAGKDDYARPNIEVFTRTLLARGIDPGYTMNPIGQHNERYWSAHVPEYIAFYAQTWPRDLQDLPSCLQ